RGCDPTSSARPGCGAAAPRRRLPPRPAWLRPRRRRCVPARRRAHVNRRLIGRDAEVAAVESFLDNVPAGALLELEGEPGIGKTALWSEACERARRRGYRVLSSRPGELETTLAYAALGDLLEEIIDEALLSLSAARRSALGRAVLHVEEPGRAPDRRAVAL